MAVEYEELKIKMLEFTERLLQNSKRMTNARDEVDTARAQLVLLATDYAEAGQALDDLAAANPDDVGLAASVADKAWLIARRTVLVTYAEALLAAMDAVE